MGLLSSKTQIHTCDNYYVKIIGTMVGCIIECPYTLATRKYVLENRKCSGFGMLNHSFPSPVITLIVF